MPSLDSPDDFGKILRSLRLSVGLTQVELAAKLGVGQPFISAMERSVRPPRGDDLLRWVQACQGKIEILTAHEVERRGQGLDPLARRIEDIADSMSETERQLMDIQLGMAEARILKE